MDNEQLAQEIMETMQRIERRHRKNAADLDALHGMLSQVATICKDAGLLEDDGPFVPFSGGGSKPPPNGGG